MRIVPRLNEAVARLRRNDAATLLLWIAAIVVLEIDGRSTSSDSDDTIRLLCVIALIMVTALRHRRGRIPWINALRRMIVHRLKLRRVQLEIGIDFRLEPPIAAQTPSWFRRLVTTATLAAGATLPLAPLFPNAARDGLVQVSYTLYLFLLLGLWALLLGGSLAFLFLPIAAIHDALVRRHTGKGPRPMQQEACVLGSAVGGLAILGFVLPGWAPLILIVAASVAAAIPALPSPAAPLTLLWRQNKSPLRSLSWSRVLALQLLFAACVSLALVCISRGDQLVPDAVQDVVRGWRSSGGDDAPQMVVTPVLGLIFAWCAGVGLLALALHSVRSAMHRRAFARAAGGPELLLLSGPSARRRIRGLLPQFAAQGLALRLAGDAPEPDHPRVILDDDAAPDDPGAFDLRWPPTLTTDALCNDRWLRLIRRRIDVLHRRRLTKGLGKAFKLARLQDSPHGEGLWVAPQHWFATGLSRDKGEEDFDVQRDPFLDDRVGPAFVSVIPWRTRAWFRVVCRGLEVDLIFVEDGVDFKRFRRVLDAAFEVHDIFGGNERLLERHLRPVPGVRAVIHDFRLGKPYQSESYPEPEYEDIARARILHVFRDRGEEPANELTPFDYRGQPAPSGRVPSFF